MDSNACSFIVEDYKKVDTLWIAWTFRRIYPFPLHRGNYQPADKMCVGCPNVYQNRCEKVKSIID